ADDVATALVCWRELRSALLATRILGVADPQQLAEANAAIVDLMAREAAIAGHGFDRPRQTAALEAMPGSDLGAGSGRSHLAAAALVAWLGALLGFFTQAIDGEGKLRRPRALGWGAAVLISLAIWLLAM
ncbi:MAG: hypothetical protein KC457_19770, partial [Myxococcales bacterium]|nr:hypothetical protein [Myxococcales bacterium]